MSFLLPTPGPDSRTRIHTATWNMDLETGSMAYTSELPLMYGLNPQDTTPETIVSQIMSRVHPEDRKILMAAMEEASCNPVEKMKDLVFRVEIGEGQTRYFQTANGQLQNGRYLFGQTTDITESMEETEGQRLGKILSLAETTLSIGFMVIDFVHRHVTLTDGIARFFGKKAMEIRHPDRWEDLIPAIDPPSREWFSKLNTLLLPKDFLNEKVLTIFNEEEQSTRIVQVKCNLDSSTNRRLILFEDVTEENQIAFQLEKHKLMLQTGAHAANIGSYVRHIASDQLEVTQELMDIYQVPMGSNYKKMQAAILSRIHPEDRQAVVERQQQSNRLESYPPFEYRILLDDGSVRWVQHSVKIQESEEFVIGTVQDVTAEVLRRQKLEKINRELEQLVYAVSHDLRAPIRHISSFAEIAQESLEYNDEEAIRHSLTLVQKASNKMAVMIDELLVFYRLRNHRINKEWLDTQAMVQEVMDLFRTETLDRQISWVASSLPHIFADQLMMEKILWNLIGNAVKFTGKTETPVIRISGKESATEVSITVSDNGAGFHMEYASKLFSLFKRLHTDQEFEGTGIGLASVKKMVQIHGGTITAEAAPEKGASFTFSLPKGFPEGVPSDLH